MTSVKASGVARFLRSPPAQISAFLLYGPDAGLISERGAALAATLAGPRGEVLRIDERSLADDPDRLHIALRAPGLFGGAPVVRVSAGGRINAEVLKPLVEDRLESRMVVESGPLRPGAPLRALFEQTAAAAALPCFAEASDTAQLVDDELKAAGLRIAHDARAALLSLLGADHAVSRSEVKKLALYCAGQHEVTRGDVDAVVGDAAGAGLDTFSDLVCLGEASGAIAQLERLEASGTQAQAALGALARHLADLHKAAAAAENKGVDAAVRAMRPPPHFKRAPALAAQITRLGAPGLARALRDVQETTLHSRRDGALEKSLLERLVMRICAP